MSVFTVSRAFSKLLVGVGVLCEDILRRPWLQRNSELLRHNFGETGTTTWLEDCELKNRTWFL
jgi:hypothetical protein